MKKNTKRKFSETFLDFSSPLLDAIGDGATKQQIENVLKITYSVWNAVILDTVKGSSDYISMLKQTMENNPMGLKFIEELISRKKNQFGNDFRLIDEYSIKNVKGEWRLRVEARDSSIEGVKP